MLQRCTWRRAIFIHDLSLFPVVEVMPRLRVLSTSSTNVVAIQRVVEQVSSTITSLEVSNIDYFPSALVLRVSTLKRLSLRCVRHFEMEDLGTISTLESLNVCGAQHASVRV